MAATDEIEENGLTKIHSDSKHTGSFQLNEYLVESPTNNHSAEHSKFLELFNEWSGYEQVNFVTELLDQMSQIQKSQIDVCLSKMLQRDFITLLGKRGMDHVNRKIFFYLDIESVKSAELVCKDWFHVIENGMLWKGFIERKVQTDSLWLKLAERRKWLQYLFKQQSNDISLPSSFYRFLYSNIVCDIQTLKRNWLTGHCKMKRIKCYTNNIKRVYCLQYDDHKIVLGLRDGVILIWDLHNKQFTKKLTGHTGSILCLQYNDNVIISSSSDSTIRIWDIHTYNLLSTQIHHDDSVLHLKFDEHILVSCSKDRTIAVWEMKPTNSIQMISVITSGHQQAISAIDFDEQFIVSASHDHTIKVYKRTDFQLVHTLIGHDRSVNCLQFRDGLILSGSSDRKIRIWDVKSGECLRILKGHNDVVSCLRFDEHRIVSGFHDGTIDIWDLDAALNSRIIPTPIQTIKEHSDKLLQVRIDEFKIVSCSYDGYCLIWDFSGHSKFKQKIRKMTEDN